MSSKRNLYVFSTSENISDTTDEQLAIIKKYTASENISDTTDEQLAIIKKATLYSRCRFDKEIYS